MTDAKLAEAALVVGCSKSVAIATWHAILENAATLNDGGRVDIPARRIAAILSEPVGAVQGLFDAFSEAGMVEGCNIVAWSKRQYESDNSTERSKKSREAAREREEAAKKKDAAPSQQDCNDDATLHKENETSPSVYVSVSDRRTSSEKITDEFEIWYSAYPRHKSRGDALKAYRKVRKTVDAEVLLVGAKAAARKYAGTDQQFTPYPASWLNGEEWKDEDLQPKPAQEPTSNGLIYVEYGTDAGDAWERHYRSKAKIPPRDKKGGWYFPTEYPEKNDTRATSSPSSTEQAA